MAGALSKLQRRRFATGGAGIDKPARMTADPVFSSEGTGRTYTPLESEADYYSYGTRPEHTFFQGSFKTPELKQGAPMVQIPNGERSSSGGGASGVLSNIQQLAQLGKLTGQGMELAGYDNAWSDALQNPVKSLKDYFGSGSSAAASGAANGMPLDAGSALGSLGSLGAGAAFGTSGAAAAGAAAPVATDAALSNLGSMTAGQLFGTSGSAAAGAGAGSLGQAGGMSSIGTSGGAAGSSGSAAGALGGAGAAIPLFMAAWMIADAVNAPGDKDSHAVSAVEDYMSKNNGWKLVGVRNRTWQMPDGRLIQFGKEAQDYARALMNGYPAEAQKAWDAWMSTAKSGHADGGAIPGEFKTGGGGALAHLVRGPGTGRSDEIPARLSAGEYVMDAETVALLGDGSTDAGAQKLDQLRAKLRAHKGKKLAQGKFSDNARDPMQYLGEK